MGPSSVFIIVPAHVVHTTAPAFESAAYPQRASLHGGANRPREPGHKPYGMVRQSGLGSHACTAAPAGWGSIAVRSWKLKLPGPPSLGSWAACARKACVCARDPRHVKFAEHFSLMLITTLVARALTCSIHDEPTGCRSGAEETTARTDNLNSG